MDVCCQNESVVQKRVTQRLVFYIGRIVFFAYTVANSWQLRDDCDIICSCLLPPLVLPLSRASEHQVETTSARSCWKSVKYVRSPLFCLRILCLRFVCARNGHVTTAQTNVIWMGPSACPSLVMYHWKKGVEKTTQGPTKQVGRESLIGVAVDVVIKQQLPA